MCGLFLCSALTNTTKKKFKKNLLVWFFVVLLPHEYKHNEHNGNYKNKKC